MTKLEYLHFAIINKCITKKSWVVSAFAIIKESTGSLLPADTYIGQIVKQPWGFSFIDGENNLIKIDDAPKDGALFNFKERLLIDSTWCENATEQTETTVGNLLFNLIAIIPSFGKKFPYVKGTVSIKKLESQIAPKLQDTPKTEADRSTEFFYVDEYVKFVNSLQYLSSFSQIATYAATPKNIKAPTGVKEFKKKLLEKYGDSLKDPVMLSKFEDELKAYDQEYLKGDPSNGTFLSGDKAVIARKKMFLTIGAEKGLSDTMEAKPILNSLNEGWPTDPESFSVLMDSSRSGSFSRGAETVRGGVSAKLLLRAANNFKIQNTDCGTKLGIRRVFRETGVNHLVGRYVIDNGKPVLIENSNMASNYLNKELIVRSPLYCQLQGDNMCTICAGKRLSQFPTGLTVPVTEISSVILATSLGAMHSQVLSTAKIDINIHLS